MTKTIKIILVGGMIGLVLILSWQLIKVKGAKKSNEEARTTKQVEDKAIPKALEKVALEEYAIEFEGAPRVTIDNELCDIVKKQCEVQGVRKCEDYEMCISGVGRQ